MTLKYYSCLKLALLQFRTWNAMACHIHNILHIITAGKPSLVIHEISQMSHGYDFNVASQEDSYLGIAGTASNEVNLSAHNVDSSQSYFIKRYNGKTVLFLTVFTQSLNPVWVPVSLRLTMICWRCSLGGGIWSGVKNLSCLNPCLRVLSYLQYSAWWSGLCWQELCTYKWKKCTKIGVWEDIWGNSQDRLRYTDC